MSNKNNEKTPALTRLPVIAALAFVSCFLWGSATPAIKTGYRLFQVASGDTPSQLLFAGIRFMLAGIMVILAGSFIRRRPLIPRKESLAHIGILSLLQTAVQYMFFYIGLAHTSGVHGAICTATNVFFSMLVAALVFRYEKLSARKLAGCAVGFAGVVLVNVYGGGGGGGFSFFGEGFIILSSLSYGFSSGFIKLYSNDEDPMTLSGWQFLFGGMILAAVGAIAGGSVHVSGAASAAILVYLAFISAMAYTLWSILLKYNPVSRVSVFGFLNPLCGVVLSALILGEQNQAFNPVGLASLVLVCLGIYIVNSTAKKS